MKKQMQRSRHYVVLIAIVFLLTTVLLATFPGASASAEPGTTNSAEMELNGATLVGENDKYLDTKVYVTKLDNGFDANDCEQDEPLLGKGNYVRFFIDTLGDGGSLYRDNDKKNLVDAYGFVAGSGEPYYKKNAETGEDEIAGYNSIAIKMQYNYNHTNELDGKDQWEISNDTWKGTINGIESVGVVGKGAVIIQKFVPTEDKAAPETKDDWSRLNQFSREETSGLHTVDFFSEFKPGDHTEPFVIYTPKGSDLEKGIYIKITVAYELVRKEKKKSWFFGAEKETLVYKNVLEETVFYLCNTSAEVTFTNLYYKQQTESTTEEEAKVDTGVEQVGGPISNNQGAVDGFRADLGGWNYDVTYRYNDSSNSFKCEDGQVFIDAGKYDFRIVTGIGVVRNKTVYIHEKTEARNLEVYFGEGLFTSDSLRVFSPTEPYPVFVQGQTTIRTLDENSSSSKHAPLVGRVYLLTKEESLFSDGGEGTLWDMLRRDERGLPVSPDAIVQTTKPADDHNWEYSQLPAGRYEAVFANNSEYFEGTATGDTYVFVWRFTIIKEGLAPFVNNELFYQQLSFSDFSSAQYAVSLPSKGSGRVKVLFGDEASANYFSDRYWASQVEVTESGYVFNGVTYHEESELLQALRAVSRPLVSRYYLDATDVDTYVTIEGNIVKPVLEEDASAEEQAAYDSYIGLLDRFLTHDVVVLPSAESLTDYAIGTPFLNDRFFACLDDNGLIQETQSPVRFISVADYESSSVQLRHVTSGKTYTIPYGAGAQTFLESKNAPSGQYLIIETNGWGKTEYEAVYIRAGENATVLTIDRTYNSNFGTIELTNRNNGKHFNVNNFILADVVNELDPYGLIKIFKNGSLLYIGQIDDYQDEPLAACDEEGNYEVCVVDRLGNSFSVFFDVYTATKVYTVTLQSKGITVGSEIAYANKRIDLPTLESTDRKLEFYGWQDQDGDIYQSTYVFNKPLNVLLTAVWHYKNVEISVYDGRLLNKYINRVGQVQLLPEPTREGYVLYGYRSIEGDTIRFYRGQITSVPNRESIRLDAVWLKPEVVTLLGRGDGEVVKLSLMDGGLYSSFDTTKSDLCELPVLGNANGMRFIGWLYENNLAGRIFTNRFNYQEVYAVGLHDLNAVKLNAIWIAEEENNISAGAIAGVTAPLSGGVNGTRLTLMGDRTSAFLLTLGGILMMACFALLGYAYRRKYAAQRRLADNQEGVASLDAATGNVARHNKRFGAGTHKALPGSFHWSKLYKLAVFPVICIVLCLALLFSMHYDTVAPIAELAVAEAEAKAEAKEDAEEHAIILQKERRKEHLDDTALVPSGAPTSASADLSMQFLIDNIIVDLAAMGYQDVFSAYAVVGADTPSALDDKRVKGIGYTAYADAYGDEDDFIFGAGFIAIGGNTFLTQEDLAGDLLVVIDEGEADGYEYTEFKLTIGKSWGPLHYVAFGNYVYYQVVEHMAMYSISPNTGEYIDALGDVYDYDIGDYCHYASYGQPFAFDAYGITSDTDYDTVLNTYRDVMQEQMRNSVSINVEHADYISYQALSDYMIHHQDERFLNLEAETLEWYEANIDETQYYLIKEDGTIQVLTLPPDPERKATVWERLWMAYTALSVAALGFLAYSIPGVGPFVSGAITGAAIDVFIQVVVFGTAPENIDWISVGVSALTGMLTAGVGMGIDKIAVSATMTVVKRTLITVGKTALKVTAGACIGVANYLISTAAHGGEITFRDCMKAIAVGAATALLASFASALGNVASKSNILFVAASIISGAAIGGASYSLTVLLSGEEFSWEMFMLSAIAGAAAATIMVVGGKIIKSVKGASERRSNDRRLKSRIKNHLPSDKNKNWHYETVDENGQPIKTSKAEFLKDPRQKMFIVHTDGTRIEIVDGYPQLDKVAAGSAYIKDGIVVKREINFNRFDEFLADKWANNPDLIPEDFKRYFAQKGIDLETLSRSDISIARSSSGLGYTWHESEDMHTGYLVKTELHRSISHCGGIERLKNELSNNTQMLQKLQMLNYLKTQGAT